MAQRMGSMLMLCYVVDYIEKRKPKVVSHNIMQPYSPQTSLCSVTVIVEQPTRLLESHCEITAKKKRLM